MLLLRKTGVILLLAFIANMLSVSALAAPETGASSVILIHADSGQVLYERNADAKMLIASTTKIMTAIVVLENCALDETVVPGAESAGVEGSSMYLRAGESYTVEELLYGMMLVSGNDAATALALHTAGSVEAFAGLMNEKAAELGMTSSSFKNPHGLDEDGHYSTARDMAKLAAYCMANEDFARIVGTKIYTVKDQTYCNHNRLLSSYDGCIGVKTGYTSAAGRSLVSCAERGDARYICVTLGDRNDWEDHAALYDWAFSAYKCVRVISPETEYSVPVVSGTQPTARAYASGRATVLMSPDDEPEYVVELPGYEFAPVRAGSAAGSVSVYVNGTLVASAPLVYARSVEIKPGTELTGWERFRRALTLDGGPYYLVESENE